jgi:hypothetical protein
MRDDVTAIAALIASGDDQAAFAQLRGRLAWPSGKDLDELPAWLGLLAELAARRGAPALAEIASNAHRDPDSPDRLYELGYALIDAGAPAIAASVLWRCLALVGDSEEVVCELVSALESALAYRDAFAILEEHAALRARSFLCAYLYAFNGAMSGRLDLAREARTQLVADSPETEAMVHTIASIIERADRVAGIATLDARDLRGWHYVLTGGLLIHQSPYGFDEPMHGRYAWLNDSLARIATGFDRLAPLVRAIQIPCVYAPPGRDHEIVARAAATRLGLPLAEWPAVGVPAPGLVVLYDLADLPAADLPRLIQRRPDQILFAHASPWTSDSPIAPDVTTLLYQSLVPPWGQSAIVDPQTYEVTPAAPDPRPTEVIAAELAASPSLSGEELDADQAERWEALALATWPPSPGLRSRLWAGGPVPSNRFD